MGNFDFKKYLVENKLTSNSKMLNEEIGDSNSNISKYFTWLKSSQAKQVYKSNLESIGNLKSNTINLPEYKSKILEIPNIQRDPEQLGLLLGDAIFSYLKDNIISSIQNLPNKSLRDFLENPTEESADGDQKLLTQTLQWKKWTESIPDNKNSKYLGNSSEFNSMIGTPVQRMFAECIENGDKNTASLVWGILPYLAQNWIEYGPI